MGNVCSAGDCSDEDPGPWHREYTGVRVDNLLDS